MPDQRPDPGPQSREIRVFISSTFRDLRAERDHPVRFVFPRLREECRRQRRRQGAGRRVRRIAVFSRSYERKQSNVPRF